MAKEEEFIEESDALTLDDLSQGFIKNPSVGESVEFEVKKLAKLTGDRLVAKKKDGGTFSKALSKVDYGYEITTVNGDVYTISAWEVFGKLKNIFKKLGKISGVKVRITHVKDGMKDRDGDSYAVEAEIDGKYKTLDRETGEWS